MDSQLLQLGGSLLAILVLAGIAWALKLGQPRTIDTAERALALAREADTAFDPSEAAVGRDGSAAILADSAGNKVCVCAWPDGATRMPTPSTDEPAPRLDV